MLRGIIYSNAGPLRKRWHLEFSSVSDENSLVPLRFAPSASVPKWNILFPRSMTKLFRKKRKIR